MNNKLIFAAGALCGAFAVWVYFKREKKEPKEEKPKVKEETAEPKPDISEDEGWEDEQKIYEEECKVYADHITTVNPFADDKPYIINEEQYQEDPEYNSMSLAYFADGALTEANTGILLDDDRDLIVGTEFIKKFAEDEDLDVVYVRNDARLYDFEIVRDPRTYMDVVRANPGLMGDYYDSYDDDEY